jgi:hypothetical protein
MLAWGTCDGQRLLVVGRMLPGMFVPPIHLSDVLVPGEVTRKPCLIAKRNKI